jgi:hypothetical protein
MSITFLIHYKETWECSDCGKMNFLEYKTRLNCRGKLAQFSKMAVGLHTFKTGMCIVLGKLYALWVNVSAVVLFKIDHLILVFHYASL